jgi:hypothetical protein
MDQLIQEWASSLTSVERFSPSEAAEYRDVILDFQRRPGISDFRTVTKRDIERYLDEADREDLKRRPARGKAAPTHDELIQELVPWLIEAGISPVNAEAHAEVIRVLYRETGVDFLALTQEELFRFIAECDRRADELERKEADLGHPPPGEPEH